MSSWIAIIILAAAQFVMVLDSSVMNVSISQIVEDLDTTVQGVQLAITLYTLVMAAFMLVGAKLGDIYGRDRTFAVGLAIYGLGSLTTAFSPSLAVLLVGWSLIEGIGACLVMPAIAALIASNYEGKQRALAYGIIGGVAAAAIAAGPLIGGWVTTTWTWRVVFAAETVVVIGILLFRKRMRPSPRLENPPSLDVVGAAMSATALALIVIAVLQSSSWGWVQPIGAPEINGVPITPLGFSIVPFMILGGLGLLWAFGDWEERRVNRGEDALLDVRLLKILTMRAGLGSMFMLQLVLLGTFFVLPVYFQTVLGLDAFETGLRLVPMSVTMLICALAGPKVAARRSPRTVSRAGFVSMAIGAAIVLANFEVTLGGWAFGDRPRDLRRRRRLPRLAGRQRDHVVGPRGALERGRWAPGDVPDARRLVRHGADRRDPPVGPHGGVHRRGGDEPGDPRRDAGRDPAAGRGVRHDDRARCAGGADRPRRGAAARRGRGRGRRL